MSPGAPPQYVVRVTEHGNAEAEWDVRAVDVVDLNGATYLDSSALGMLLLLRDHAGSDKADIRLINCNPDVRKVLSVSNFEQLFAIA